jgi:hypothetical protein
MSDMNKLRRTHLILVLSVFILFAAICRPGWLMGEEPGPTHVVKAKERSPEKRFKITLRTGKNRDAYRIGETVKFMFRTNRSCFVTLFDLGTDGSVVRLFPNKLHPDNRVRADRTYEIPPRNAGLRLRVRGPEGTERVVAVATLKRPASARERALKSGKVFPSLENPRSELKRFRENTASLGASGWTGAKLTFRVVASRADLPSRKPRRAERDRSNAAATASGGKPSIAETREPESAKPAEVKRDVPSDRVYRQKREAAADKPTPAKKLRVLAVSLRVLQEKLKECSEKHGCPDRIVRLCGMRRVLGYVVDAENRDIVILGRRSGSTPRLHTEDLAVALRNVWEMGEAPGCSIDPDPAVISRLRKLSSDGSAGVRAGGFKKGDRSWKRICSEPQRVRVMGVPFDSRFAEVMVKADYYMKRLVNGSVNLGINGFKSLTGLTLDLARRELKRGDSVSLPPMVHNRFWFAAGENSFLSDKGTIRIKESQVVLLTEEEFLTKTGEIQGRGRPNPLARKFCDLFSKNYSMIAKKKPIYAELENLFRLVALAKIMKLRVAPKEAGLDMQYLLTEYSPGKTTVKRFLPGLSNYSEIRRRKDRMIYRFRLRNCGGVAMAPVINDRVIRKDVKGTTGALRHDVIKSRPSRDSLSWEVVARPPVH